MERLHWGWLWEACRALPLLVAALACAGSHTHLPRASAAHTLTATSHQHLFKSALNTKWDVQVIRAWDQ